MNKEEHHIAILIMAAGASRRMEGIKQLLPWKNSNFLSEALKTAKQSTADSIYIALGANAEIISNTCKLQELNVEYFVNPQWSMGLGNSIAFGVKELLDLNPNTDGILVCLADQPLLTPSYLDAIIKSFKKDTTKIIATNYMNRAGVPALFPKSQYIHLMQLNGDQGAKHILDGHFNELIRLDAKEQITDIDTKSEYEQLQRQYKP